MYPYKESYIQMLTDTLNKINKKLKDISTDIAANPALFDLRLKVAKELYTLGKDCNKTGEWVSVGDRLPIRTNKLSSCTDPVLVVRTNGECDVCSFVYDDEGNYWTTVDDRIQYEPDEITHWMPLPKLPKE